MKLFSHSANPSSKASRITPCTLDLTIAVRTDEACVLGRIPFHRLLVRVRRGEEEVLAASENLESVPFIAVLLLGGALQRG